MGGGGWSQLDFTVRADDEDEATARLHEAGLPGWEVIDARGDQLTLRVWVLPEDAASVSTALAGLTEEAPRRSGVDLGAEWQKTWRPERVGRFAIGALGGPEPDVSDGAHPIVLAPVLAFGGGEHPTTRLCLEQLPDLVGPGSAVLDVGSGSGVLSIASARLGASHIDAVDVDPTARRATARAARANEVSVSVREEGLAMARGPYHLIVANILAPVLVALAEDLMQRLAPSGRILLSGIRRGHEDSVLEAYAPLSLVVEKEQEGWLALRLGSVV